MATPELMEIMKRYLACIIVGSGRYGSNSNFALCNEARVVVGDFVSKAPKLYV